MKVLVLGGTRFVGLRLLRQLVQGKHDITILNRGRTKAELPASIKRLYADRRNPYEVRRLLKGLNFDVIYDMTGYQTINVEPLVEEFAGKISHYFLQSTSGVYDSTEYIPIRENSPTLSPVTDNKGLAAYAQDKSGTEQYLLRTFKERGFPVTIFRSPVIYGPENWMEDREASYFVRLLQNRRILIPASGSTFLQYTHVDDLAKAYIDATKTDKVNGQAYNITSDYAITINGYVDVIAKVVGVKPRKIYVEGRFLRDLKNQDLFPIHRWDKSVYYDTSKAKRDFGFQPQYDMEEGMRQTYEWWKENKGIEKTEFTPGKLGHNVNFAEEDEVFDKYGSEKEPYVWSH